MHFYFREISSSSPNLGVFIIAQSLAYFGELIQKIAEKIWDWAFPTQLQQKPKHLSSIGSIFGVIILIGPIRTQSGRTDLAYLLLSESK